MGVESILYWVSVACTENLCEAVRCWRTGRFLLICHYIVPFHLGVPGKHCT